MEVETGHETISSEERVRAAIRLEKPDHVPIVPLVGAEPAAGLAGLTQAQVANDNQLALSAALKVFDKYGGYDCVLGGVATPLQRQLGGRLPLKMRIPGKNLADDCVFQLVEEEVLKPQDYETICEMGMDAFYNEDYLWRICDLESKEVERLRQDAVKISV